MFKLPMLKLIIPVLVLSIFLLGGVVSAQEVGIDECTAANGDCTEQGLELASLLENRGISFSLVVFAGLIDGLNPCAVGMLILLLGYLLVFAKEHSRMIKIGFAYILSVFFTYLLIGIFFSQIVYSLLAWPYYHTVSEVIKWVVVILIWLAALINIKDFFRYGWGPSLGVTKREVPILMKYIKKVDWHATIVLGILVTIFELPCSLPLYIGSIAIMTETFTAAQTIGYLVVYNIMFVLPLIIIFSVISRGHKIFEAKDLQERSNKWMKLLMGIAQIIIGIGLLLI